MSRHGELDPLYEQARRLVLTKRLPVASYLGSRLQIDAGRAERLLQTMEGDVVTPPDARGHRSIIAGQKDAWRFIDLWWAPSLTPGQPHLKNVPQLLRAHPHALIPALLQAAIIAWFCWILGTHLFRDPELAPSLFPAGIEASIFAWPLVVALAAILLAVNLLWLALGWILLPPSRIHPGLHTVAAPCIMAWLPLRLIAYFWMPKTIQDILGNGGDHKGAMAITARLLQAGIIVWALSGESAEIQGNHFTHRLDQDGNAVIDALASYVYLPIYVLGGAAALWLSLPIMHVDLFPAEIVFAGIAFILALNKAALIAYLISSPWN